MQQTVKNTIRTMKASKVFRTNRTKIKESPISVVLSDENFSFLHYWKALNNLLEGTTLPQFSISYKNAKQCIRAVHKWTVHTKLRVKSGAPTMENSIWKHYLFTVAFIAILILNISLWKAGRRLENLFPFVCDILVCDADHVSAQWILKLKRRRNKILTAATFCLK